MSTHDTPTEPEKELSIKQQQAALLLANGSTIAVTSQQIGVNEKTIDLWKRKPEFMGAIRAAEDELYNNSLKLLKRTAQAAIVCLVRNMGEKVSPYVQVNAASKLLDAAIEIHKIQELEAEVAELRLLLEAKEQLDQWQQ